MPFVLVADVFFVSNVVAVASSSNDGPDASLGGICSFTVMYCSNEENLVCVGSSRFCDFKKSMPKICVPLICEVKHWEGQHRSALAG